MRPSTQTPARGRANHQSRLPLAAFHAPLPGEDVALFSDRKEDDLELEAILHEFEERHDAEL